MDHASHSTDLLLLNASNYPNHVVFPYAFVQVSALARIHGLSTSCFDLLGTPRVDWPSVISHLLAAHKPRVIGIHLRQADSQRASDYLPPADSRRTAYFPVDATSHLVQLLRTITDTPIVIGGFGFSVHSTRLFEQLRPDWGVRGAPDDFLRKFDDLVSGVSDPTTVANLVFENDGQTTSAHREFYGPLDEPEYDEGIFSTILTFYASHGVRLRMLGQRDGADLPIEVMRGCPARCYYCTEPSVQGREVRFRDLDAILADVAFLAHRGVRGFWFICPELNMGGMEFPLELAERMLRFNRDRRGRAVTWRAYCMPRPGMSRADLTFLMRSGFAPGWNEVLSFDDENLRRAGMPYRSRDAKRFLQDIRDLSQDPALFAGIPSEKLEMFLGNAFVDGATISKTLEAVDEIGLARGSRWADVTRATRSYEVNGELSCGEEGSLLTVDEWGARPFDILHPTFYFPPDLMAHLGSFRAIDEFFSFVEDTFLSTFHVDNFDSAGFIRASASAAALAAAISEVDDPVTYCGLLPLADLTGQQGHGEFLVESQRAAMRVLRRPTLDLLLGLLSPPIHEIKQADSTLRVIWHVIRDLSDGRLRRLLGHLRIPVQPDGRCKLSPYRIMRILYGRYASNEALLADARETLGFQPESLEELLLRHFLCEKNVIIKPEYRGLLFAED